MGRAPGKNANKTAAFSIDMAIPHFLLISKKAATIGISHIWYMRKGAYGAGTPKPVSATVSAAKTMIIVIAFVFILGQSFLST